MKSAISAFCVFLVLLSLSLAQQAAAMDLQLTGKTALITGSTGGIGYGIAKVLLREGAQVIINGRTPESVAKAVASLKVATGKTPLGFAGDMSKADDIARLGKRSRTWISWSTMSAVSSHANSHNPPTRIGTRPSTSTSCRVYACRASICQE
jgi:hypothetical protein